MTEIHNRGLYSSFNVWGVRGNQRPFGTFPKIHPFWRCGASLSIQFISNVDEHAHADEDVLKEKQGGHWVQGPDFRRLTSQPATPAWRHPAWHCRHSPGLTCLTPVPTHHGLPMSTSVMVMNECAIKSEISQLFNISTSPIIHTINR